MKRVLFYYPAIFPTVSGQSVHGYNVVKHLAAEGVEVVAYAQKPCDFYRSIKKGNLFALLAALARVDAVYYRPPIDRMTWFERIMRLFRKPLKILEINGPIEEKGHQRGTGKVGRRERNCLRNKLSASTHIVVVSSALKTYLVNHFEMVGSKISVIPNGCSVQQFEGKWGVTWLVKEKRTTVFWAGNPDLAIQNTEKLLKIATLAMTSSDLLFVLGGFRMTPPAQDNIAYLPPIPYDQIQHYIADAGILLVSYGDYRWSPAGFYNSSLKFFEYMCSGRPVVAPRLGQIAEIIEDGVNGVLYDDCEEACQKILELAESQERRERIGAKGKATVVNSFSWNAVARRIIQIPSSAGNS